MARIKIEMPDKFVFSTDIPVRITDLNYGRHLGNDAVLSIIHEARVQFLNASGYSEENIEGVGILMADAAIVYKSEAFYNDMLRIEIAVSEFSKRGCDLIHRITLTETGKDVAHVKTGIVFFDYSTRKTVRVPDAFRNRFE